jgi:hypothetical protein
MSNRRYRGDRVERPTNVAIITFLIFAGGIVLAAAGGSLLILGAIIATAGDGGEPISVAITGMTVAAGFASLILAFIFACLGVAMPDFHDWARTASTSAIFAGLEPSCRSILSSANRFWDAAFPPRNKNHKLSYRP